MKLLKAEIVTMEILRRQGETNQSIAKRLGITEGAVRYHLKRMPHVNEQWKMTHWRAMSTSNGN